MKKRDEKKIVLKDIKSENELLNINGGFSLRDVIPSTSAYVVSTSSNKDKK